jgi:hypothetical protein
MSVADAFQDRACGDTGAAANLQDAHSLVKR